MTDETFTRAQLENLASVAGATNPGRLAAYALKLLDENEKAKETLKAADYFIKHHAEWLAARKVVEAARGFKKTYYTTGLDALSEALLEYDRVTKGEQG